MDNPYHTEGWTFEVHSVFDEKRTLGQILAARVLHDLEQGRPDIKTVRSEQ